MADTMVSQPSSPTTLLSQSSTLVETQISHPPPSALLSVTPELLLQIISYLPTTSYHPLTRTSHGLRLFFKIHAAHICNTHITQHFAWEAHLLRSVVRDGWLVPTHQSVYTNLSSTSLPRTEELLVLSEPGPHYLRFLQEYSKDIQIRAEMTIQSSFQSLPLATDLSMDSVAGPDISPASETLAEKSDEANDQAERDFTFMISTYCVRPFTTRLNSAPPTPNKCLVPARQVFGEVPPSPNEKPQASKLDDTHGALRWYFGAAGVNSCPAEDCRRIGIAPTKGVVLSIWERVKILVKRRREKQSVTKIYETHSNGFKRNMRAIKIRVMGVGGRMGHKLLAATKRSCLRHEFRSLG